MKTVEINKGLTAIEEGSEVISDSAITGSLEARHSQHAAEKMGLFQTIWWANKVSFPVPIAIFLIYIQTFTMFPGLALEKNFGTNF